MGIRLPHLFRRTTGTTSCVVPDGERRFRPSKSFVIVILLSALATLVLSLVGVSMTTGIQVVVEVVAGVQAARELTAWAHAAEPVTVR